MLKERMDRFVQDMVDPLAVRDAPMRRRGEALLREAESSFPGLNLQQQAVLRQGIEKLRKILYRWDEREVSARDDEIARLRRRYESLRGIPHKSPEQIAEMESLRDRMSYLRGRRPERPGPLIVGPKTQSLPREVKEAEAFRARMARTPLIGEASLTRAIRQTEGEIRKLEQYCSTLSAEGYELYGTQAIQESSALGDLIQRWNRQIEGLRVQESFARTSRWEQDKSAEKMRTYLASKRAALAKGAAQTEAVKKLREATQEMSGAFQICEMVLKQAVVRIMPEAVPVDKVSAVIVKFDNILTGLRAILPENEVRQATRNLNRLKAYRAEMEEHLKRLGYGRDIHQDEARRESQGLTYFRANVPAAVREILSVTTLSKLETLAATGLNGAKEAITSAIYMAAKRNPQRMRAVLGG